MSTLTWSCVAFRYGTVLRMLVGSFAGAAGGCEHNHTASICAGGWEPTAQRLVPSLPLYMACRGTFPRGGQPLRGE